LSFDLPPKGGNLEMDRKLKVGVVGCGQIAQIAHIPYILELPHLELVALCDLSQKVVNSLGDLYGIQNRFTNYQDLISLPELDVVCICNKDHAPVAVAAMNAGKHVLTEKPMAFNLEECDQMIAAAKANHVKLMVAYMKRYDPAYEWALAKFKDIRNLRLIRVHDLGGTYTINNKIYDLFVGDDVPNEIHADSKAHEYEAMVKAIGAEHAGLYETFSLLMYNCSHDAIVLHEAFGLTSKILHVELFDTFVVAVLEYGPHTRCVWETGLIPDRTEWDEHIAAYGSNRYIEVKFPFPYLKNADTWITMNEMEGEASVTKQVLVSYDEAFKREWRHFYDCVVNDREPITNGEKGRRDIEFLINLIHAGGI
jgi:predicted dehydrogenase